MACQMALYNDVLGRIHTILKQDDHFRTLEDLPVIDGLRAYDDIQLFPELFDTSAVIERITNKANLIEKQLNRSGVYPLPQTPLSCTSSFIPRPSSTFQPITPAAPSPATGVVAAKPLQEQQSKETSQAVHYNVDKEQLLPQQTHRPQYNQMAAPPTRVHQQITYQCTHSLHPLM